MSNRLSSASSPYLIQHADNPVDWYAWGDEAFSAASRRDVPMFISIGYATCHWCHVMERESFENDDIAGILNDHFVAVKVDREEHPDVDHFYMTACTAGGRRGGWPLTIITMPDGRPFYAATYLPPTSARGRAGLSEVLVRVARLWMEDREAVTASARDVTKLVQRLEKLPDDARTALPDSSVVKTCIADSVSELASSYDPGHGGFGRAPKFPAFHRIRFLLEAGALKMANESLSAMRMGGIWDHVGHGFHRYSTDRHWHLPHFEKMLYDQAMALIAYAEAYAVSSNPIFERTAGQIHSVLATAFRSDDGLMYSAWDADSEGEEGKFYVWGHDELSDVLEESQLALLEESFGVREEGNYDEEASRTPSGKNVLDAGLDQRPPNPIELINSFEPLRLKLEELRSDRTPPIRDEKCLTDWNGMYIAASSVAGRLLESDDLITSATVAAETVWAEMRSGERGLAHRRFEGRVGVEGGLDDYAMMAWGLLELFQATGRGKWLRYVIQTCDEMIDRFMDDEEGTFYISRRSDLPVRQSRYRDEAYPAGAAVGLHVLARLASIAATNRYTEVCERVFSNAYPRIDEWKAGHLTLLSAVRFFVGATGEVVITGERDSNLSKEVSRAYLPHHVVVPAYDGERESVEQILPFVASFPEGEAAVYLCENKTCERPIRDLGVLRERLSEKAAQ